MIPFHLRVALLAALGLGHGQLHAQADLAGLLEQTDIQAGPVAVREMPGWREPRKIVLRDVGIPLDGIRGAVPGVEIVPVTSEDEAIRNASSADAIVGWCSPRLLAAAPDAVWVQIFAAGVERCMATERIADGSVVLTNMQKIASPVIAEHVIAMTLSLARGLPQFAKAMPDGVWLRRTPIEDGMQSVAGKTMLVAGLGGIGTEVARRAAALGIRVVGTRRSSREGPDFVAYVGLSHELHELAGEADFIVNALPLTNDTAGLFDADFFRAAKRGALFVNVGRGKSVVTDDLVAALASGQIAGAGLDVTDPEPLPGDHVLWQTENVIITPHVASGGGNRIRHGILLRENLRRFVAGERLLNVVDPARGY